jgi:hypothetical protein
MAYQTPTIDQFKAQFFRDFPYAVPSFGATGTAVISGFSVTAVNITSGGFFYQKTPLVSFSHGIATAHAVVTNNAVSSIVVDSGGSGYAVPPTVTITSQDGDDTDIKKVTNIDILAAQNMGLMNINQGLFESQLFYSQCFNLLTAHYMVTNLLASTQGVKSQYDWLTSQRSIGNVNSSFAIPDRVKKSMFLSTLTQTRYGAQYISLIAPLLLGNVRLVVGDTTP